MMNQSTQGLASLGRNGDTMLMHVNPDELRGLQGLAMSQGGSLSINPHTGLPEAFKLGNWGSEKVTLYTPYLKGDKFNILQDGEKCCKQLGWFFFPIV